MEQRLRVVDKLNCWEVHVDLNNEDAFPEGTDEAISNRTLTQLVNGPVQQLYAILYVVLEHADPDMDEFLSTMTQKLMDQMREDIIEKMIEKMKEKQKGKRF